MQVIIWLWLKQTFPFKWLRGLFMGARFNALLLLLYEKLCSFLPPTRQQQYIASQPKRERDDYFFTLLGANHDLPP
jgi:hypothetical protein